MFLSFGSLDCLPLHPASLLQVSLGLFLVFAVVVVHLCQRLVEHATLVIEPLERRVAFARAGLCIGSLVWALDLAGFCMYPGISLQGLRPTQAVLALLVMLSSARLSIPALTNTRSRPKLLVAALGISVGMMAAHVLLVSSLGDPCGCVAVAPAAMAMALGVAVSGTLALKHRSARLRAVRTGFAPLTWPVKAGAGLVVLLMHICLANSLPVHAIPASQGGAAMPLLLSLVLFGVVIRFELAGMEREGHRQALLDRALALVRSVHPGAGGGEHSHRLALVAERLPLLAGRIDLHFQPICPLGEEAGGVRFEALMRLEDPDLGRIDPELFFLACERVGKSDWVDRLIILMALDRTVACRLRDVPWAGVSVNTSPATLLAADFVPWLRSALRGRNLPSHWLLLEITEHTLIASLDRLRGVLEQLRGMGVGVIMDDFGTGFSSLSVLASLPIHGLKCDRSFVRNLATEPAGATILGHICRLARSLDLPVTVEGVENQADLAVVRNCGAQAVQGWVFARAMPLADACRWLEAQQSPGGLAAPGVRLLKLEDAVNPL